MYFRQIKISTVALVAGALAIGEARSQSQPPSQSQVQPQAQAQTGGAACKSEEIAAVIDETGAKLRQYNAETQPRLRSKLRDVAQKRGWSDADLQAKGLDLLQDEETRNLDEQAAQLLLRLDALGDDSRAGAPPCQRLANAKVAATQLLEVTSARSTHVLARLEATLQSTSQPSAGAPATPSVAAQVKPEVRAPKAPAPQQQSAVTPDSKSTPRPTPPPAGWTTATVHEMEPNPKVIAELPKPIDPGAAGFSPEDIRAAGRGIFGTASAGVASVIDYAFTTYGRPTGYILGQEGGGAFLAGLRYGDGTLVTKLGGEQKIYWQGPSVGYDFGLAGSQVMILVYNVEKPEQLHTRFVGVDGSAYLVGGAGITFLKKGPLVLAPIRTGLGLRVGANIGYLKFTPSASLNPF